MSTGMHRDRLDAVLAALRESGARSVLDLGCGDGALLAPLLGEPWVERVVGVDAHGPSLARLRRRLTEAERPERARLIEGDFTAPALAQGLGGFDAAALVEVIEHLPPERLSAVEAAVFRRMRPATVVLTTPNAEFNALLGTPPSRMRHPDHRFEWGRAQFARWCQGVAARTGYAVALSCVGGAHPALGGPSQMATFSLGRG